MIKAREFHVFSIHCSGGFDEVAIEQLKPVLKATDFSEISARVTLNAFVEVTLKSDDRIAFIGQGLRDYCTRNALGFGESRGKLVAVYSLGKLLSRPTGEAVTRAVEAAQGIRGR